MNRSTKSLILAAGVAVATLTVSVPAHADPVPNGPGTIEVGPIVDPQPQPQPTPVPAGPGEIANPPHCTHGCGGNQDPQGPKDIGPAPTEDVINNGPLEAAEPTDDPAHDAPLDQGCFTGCDLPEEPAASAEPTPEATPVVLDSDKPSAADQLDRGEALAPSATENGGINQLLFVLGAAGAAGLILAAVARRRRQQADEA
jgi:hypothetical protein